MPADGGADASADAAPSDASAAPFLGAWEYRGTWMGSAVGGGSLSGDTHARVTFRADGRVESEWTLTVAGCVAHREQSLASWQWPGADVIRISSRVCTPTDDATCPMRPTSNGTNAGCFLHDTQSFLTDAMGGSYTQGFSFADGGAELRFERGTANPWARAM